MITPEQLAASGTEHGQQTALFAWAALHKNEYPGVELMFAIPNGGYRNKAEAAKLKAEGVKAGVSDVFLPVPKGGFCGLFIEMKNSKGKMSEAQTEFAFAVIERGYSFSCCYSFLEAKNAIERYMAL